MAQKVTKAESTLIAVLVIISLPILGFSKLYESVGWVPPTIAVFAVIVLVLLFKYAKRQRRLSYLRNKYQDEALVQRIYKEYFWENQSAEQLRDSLGPPAAIDNKLLKTKTREIWKYNHQGANRYSLRITVENGYVSGWDQKA